MKTVRVIIICLFFVFVCPAQRLTVGVTTGLPGSVVRVPLTLSGAKTLPAGLQWTLTFTKTISVVVIPGPEAIRANKVPDCSTKITSQTTVKCIMDAVNKNVMANGVVAYLDVTLPSNLTTYVSINASSTQGTTVDAHYLQFGAVGGRVTKGTPTPAPTQADASEDSSEEAEVGEMTLSIKEVSCEVDKTSHDIKCNVALAAPVVEGVYYYPFVTRTDLFVSPNPVWVEKEGDSFTFSLFAKGNINLKSVVIGVVFGEETVFEVVSLLDQE